MLKTINIPQDVLEQIIDKYVNEKYSLYKLARIFHHSESTIKKHLLLNGIHIRDLRESHELPFDKMYFEQIDTPEKAYWLGFIYADGSISKRNVFSIKLSIKDKEHLYKFKKDINSQHIIGEYEMNTKYGNIKYCMFNIHSIHLCNQLQKLGVNENKTQECNFPDESILPEKYKWDFIRGFFDGDGSVYISNYKWKYREYHCLGVSFTGTENMLQSILQEIKKYCNTNTKVRKYYDGKPVYDLKFGGINLINNIYHLLYDNSTRWLKRKRTVFEYFIEDGNLKTIKT